MINKNIWNFLLIQFRFSLHCKMFCWSNIIKYYLFIIVRKLPMVAKAYSIQVSGIRCTNCAAKI